VHRTFLHLLSRLLVQTRSSFARDFNDQAITDPRVESMRIPSSLEILPILFPFSSPDSPNLVHFFAAGARTDFTLDFRIYFPSTSSFILCFANSTNREADSLNSQHFKLRSKCSLGVHVRFQELKAKYSVIEVDVQASHTC